MYRGALAHTGVVRQVQEDGVVVVDVSDVDPHDNLRKTQGSEYEGSKIQMRLSGAGVSKFHKRMSLVKVKVKNLVVDLFLQVTYKQAAVASKVQILSFLGICI